MAPLNKLVFLMLEDRPLALNVPVNMSMILIQRIVGGLILNLCLDHRDKRIGGSGPSSTAAAPKAQKPPGGKQQQPSGPFTPRQRQAILSRYQSLDPSPNGRNGIPVDVIMAMPEFATNKLIGILVHDYANSNTGCLHQEEFLQFCLFLSNKTPPREKKRMLFETFNVYEGDSFTHDEIFRLYKVLLGHTISDDLILALTFKALQHPGLKKSGEITKEEFIRLIPDSEIEAKLTVYFNIPPN